MHFNNHATKAATVATRRCATITTSCVGAPRCAAPAPPAIPPAPLRSRAAQTSLRQEAAKGRQLQVDTHARKVVVQVLQPASLAAATPTSATTHLLALSARFVTQAAAARPPQPPRQAAAVRLLPPSALLALPRLPLSLLLPAAWLAPAEWAGWAKCKCGGKWAGTWLGSWCA